MNNNKTTKNAKSKVANVVGIVLCIILVPILIINCTLIIKGMINKDEVPSIGGISPMIVLTESMEPTIKAGDLIFVKKIGATEVEVGNIITFFDPASKNSSVVTHEVIKIEQSGNKLYFYTKGENNNAEDPLPVPDQNLIGIYTGTRLGGLGHIAMFMQSTLGLVVCIFVPIAAFVAYEIVRRKKHDSAKQQDIDALKAELEALKQAQQNNDKQD